MDIFTTTKTSTYPNLVKNFYSYFTTNYDTIFSFSMHSEILINVKISPDKFCMDASLIEVDAESFLHYNKEQAIRFIFPYDIPLDVYGNFIVKYMIDCGKRANIKFIPYGCFSHHLLQSPH